MLFYCVLISKKKTFFFSNFDSDRSEEFIGLYYDVCFLKKKNVPVDKQLFYQISCSDFQM